MPRKPQCRPGQVQRQVSRRNAPRTEEPRWHETTCFAEPPPRFRKPHRQNTGSGCAPLFELRRSRAGCLGILRGLHGGFQAFEILTVLFLHHAAHNAEEEPPDKIALNVSFHLDARSRGIGMEAKPVGSLHPHHAGAGRMNLGPLVLNDLDDGTAPLASLLELRARLHAALGEHLDFRNAGEELRRVVEVGREIEDLFDRLVDDDAAFESGHAILEFSTVFRSSRSRLSGTSMKDGGG